MANNKSNGECPPVCASGENHQYNEGHIEEIPHESWEWPRHVTITIRTCTKCGVEHTREVSRGHGYDKNYEKNTYESKHDK